MGYPLSGQIVFHIKVGTVFFVITLVVCAYVPQSCSKESLFIWFQPMRELASVWNGYLKSKRQIHL